MKQSQINLPEDPSYVQMNLFGATGVESLSTLDPFPEVLRDEAGFNRVLEMAESGLGLDFEFNPKTRKPSILGIAVPTLAAAIPWNDKTGRRTIEWCIQNGIQIVGHSVVGADKPVLEQALGIQTPLKMWEDTMLKHYLLHQDFCKAVDKEEDEGSLGFMNLWCMASMTTNAYQWKICRGRACDGPCPKHNVFGYCGVDSWAGIAGNIVMDRQMKEMGVPYQFYRELMELAEICDKMEKQGLRINVPYIEQLDKEMEAAKDAIFEFEQRENSRVYTKFNPKSPDQIIEWFKARQLTFPRSPKTGHPSTDIKFIQKILEKQGLKEERGELADYLNYLEENSGALDETTRELYNLYRFKKSGKGTDAWFSDKYRNGSYIHPRFIVPGTSSGRLASSRPNFTNIPVRGWAVVKNPDGTENHRIKTAIIPRDESLEFIESDFSQLELRDVLYLAGVDPSVAGADAFSWLVEEANGLFEKAAAGIPALAGAKNPGRDAAKSMAHAGNYMEGFDLLYSADFQKSQILRQISNGSLRVYSKKYMPGLRKDWEFCGGVVCFTGANLAMRFFGDKSEPNRKKALDIQEDVYFKKFSMIRDWQRSVLDQIESRGYVQSPTGRFLRLYGSPRDNAKVGVATLGQGVGADHVEAVMIKFYREFGVIPVLMVHDSLVFEIPKKWNDKKAYEFIRPMFDETFRLPGFKCPGKPQRGPNYGELRELAI